MGSGMALNLHRQGTLVSAWNRTRARIEGFAAEHGLPLADDPLQVVEEAKLIITCVSRDQDLLEVVDLIAPALTADKVVLDTSTVSVETAREAASRIAVRAAAFIDAPVSGGREGAHNGSLVMMTGGDAATLDRLRPTLACLTRSVTHMGPVGAGQATKAVNQIMVAGINQAVTEALAFGETQGLDMEQVIDVISGGTAGNWCLDHRGRNMVAGSYDPGFKLVLHHKDLLICQRMAEAAGLDLPLIEQTLSDYRQLLDEHGEEDISTLFHLKRKP
jgi:3-hydroxyisobutyrate dehydrogenase